MRYQGQQFKPNPVDRSIYEAAYTLHNGACPPPYTTFGCMDTADFEAFRPIWDPQASGTPTRMASPGDPTQSPTGSTTPSPSSFAGEGDPYLLKCLGDCDYGPYEVLYNMLPLSTLPGCIDHQGSDCLWAAADVIPWKKIVGIFGHAAMPFVTRMLSKEAPRGIWDVFYGTVRGRRLEVMMGKNLPDAYPVIDVYDVETGIAKSIKTRDLSLKTYNEPGGLERQMKEDIDKLKNMRELVDFEDAYLKGMPINKKVLEVAVPMGPFTAAQDEAFRKAFQYGRRVGVEVIVTVIY